MSSLYIYNKHLSHVNNLPTLFFNLLSPNYFNSHLNTPSTNYNIYLKILKIFNPDISFDKDVNYEQFKNILNKYIYKTLDKNINEYISILISKKEFMHELFKYDNFQYYTNSPNEILRLLADNSQVKTTFNISKNYKNFKTKYILDKKNKRKQNIHTDNQDSIKDRLFKIYVVIDGLEKLMFNRYENLMKYDKFSFNQIYNHITNIFGTTHLNFYNKNYIYFKYNNNTINYIDIFTTILNNPDLQDKIVLLFIKHSYLKYNEKIDEILLYEKYKNIIKDLYKQFIQTTDDEYEDDDILNLSITQKQNILQKSIPKLYTQYNKILLEYFKDNFKDNLNYSYTDLNKVNINTKLEKIPINYINNIILNIDSKLKSSEHIIIQDSDIIKNILPNITEANTKPLNNLNSHIVSEAINRIEMLTSNKDKQLDVDYINHTLNFFKDNFEDEENLEQLLNSISYLNIPFLKSFNLKVLRIKKITKKNDVNLINNILGEVNEETNTPNTNDDINIDDNTFIISDYNILSPIYTSNFKITLDKKIFIFKSLLHYIYYNQFLMLYKIYCNYTSNSEASIIPTYKFAYNLLFKNSKYNITEINKEILSNTNTFKTYNELENDYNNLLNEIKLFLFKYEINTIINNDKIPYYNFIINYSYPLNIIFSDKYDDYLGIGNYGNGKNMIGKFLEEYRENIEIDHSKYDYKDIFLIMCDFNQNVFKWFELKLHDILSNISYIGSVLKKHIIDISFIKDVLKHLYPSYSKSKVYNIPIIQNFYDYSKTTIQSLSEIHKHILYNITNNAIDEIWYYLISTVHTLFNFQQDIISNDDNYQTFISLYDKYDIEHILYYILSSHTYNDVNESIDNYIQIKNSQFDKFNSLFNINPIYTLFNKNVDSDNYYSLIDEYNQSLSFNIKGETKYINIIKSKLKLSQN